MKKYFKVLGIALLATTMFSMTSCNDEQEVALSEDGITVTFDGNTWKAQTIDATTTTTAVIGSRRSFDFFATSNAALPKRAITQGGEVIDSALCTWPMIYVFGKASGTSSDDQMEVRYLENQEETYAFINPATEYYEFYNWQSKVGEDLEVRVTEYDGSALKISGTVKGNLFKLSSTNDYTTESKYLSVVFKNISVRDLDANVEE